MAPRTKRGKLRGNGEGALYFSEKLSRWVGVATVPDPVAKDGRRRIKVTAQEKAEAKDKLDDALRKIKEGTPVGKALETVADVLRYWLERGLDRKKVKSQNTIDNLTWAVEKQLIPAIGARRLRDLECEHVEDMLTDMAARGMSSSSLTRVHTTLTRALKWAQRRGKVYRNVSDLVETPVGTSRPSQALTVAQVQAVLDTATGTRLRALWTLGLILGMRPGELTGLRWEDINFDTNVITVGQSLKHNRGALWQGDTKTRQSRRRFKALPVTLTALKSHRAGQAAEKLKAGPAWTETGLVFTTETGTPIDPANLRRAFRTLIKAAGIPDKEPTEESPKPGQWHPNEMRHSAGSYMDAMGVPPKRVASILGHEGTRTTETVYIHGQEVIDMTGDEFQTYGNQFGNQPEEGAGGS
jgi:integrase